MINLCLELSAETGSLYNKRRTMSNNFRIKTMVLGMVSTNCYLVYNNDIKEGVVVDPADKGAYILNK